MPYPIVQRDHKITTTLLSPIAGGSNKERVENPDKIR